MSIGRSSVLCLVLLGTASLARSQDNEVSFDFFYAALQESGTWLESADYGYVWQPKVATRKPDWRPYADGYWSQTDQGWTWVSHEDFGWATYHYGRWAKLADAGWVWVPGFEWAPAWVAWRASPKFSGRKEPPRVSAQVVEIDADEVIGWAPLPPEATRNDAAGFSPQVDVVYGIGPACYNFVPARNFGEVALSAWIFRSSHNYGFVGSTWNCTNLVYRPRPVHLWCGGPSYAALRPVVQRPIPQLSLVAQPPGGVPLVGGYANRVEGTQLFVTAPRVTPPAGVSAGAIGLPINRVSIKPPLTGPPIAAQPIDRGWSGGRADAVHHTALRAQMQKQASAAPRIAAAPASLPRPTNPISVVHPGVARTASSMRSKSAGITHRRTARANPPARPVSTKPAAKPVATPAAPQPVRSGTTD